MVSRRSNPFEHLYGNCEKVVTADNPMDISGHDRYFNC